MSDEHVTLPDDDPGRPDGDPVGEGAEPVEAAPAEPAPLVCRECGAPLEEGQPYCLECGAPTPFAPGLRRRIGPAGVLAIGLLALGIGAGALAYAVSTDDKPTASVGSTQTVTTFPTNQVTTFTTNTNTSTIPPFPTSSTGFTQTFPTGTTSTFTGTTQTFTQPTTGTTQTQTTPTGTTTTTTTTGPTAVADTWPDGTSGYTVILSSTHSASEAAGFRSRVVATGRSAGILETSRYADLEPDYWSVFSGTYSSRAAAISAAGRLRATYPGAYAVRVREA